MKAKTGVKTGSIMLEPRRLQPRPVGIATTIPTAFYAKPRRDVGPTGRRRGLHPFRKDRRSPIRHGGPGTGPSKRSRTSDTLSAGDSPCLSHSATRCVALDVDRSRRRLGVPLLGLALAAWTAWFLLGRVAVYEVTDRARLEVQSSAHPLAAPVDGRVLESRLTDRPRGPAGRRADRAGRGSGAAGDRGTARPAGGTGGPAGIAPQGDPGRAGRAGRPREGAGRGPGRGAGPGPRGAGSHEGRRLPGTDLGAAEGRDAVSRGDAPERRGRGRGAAGPGAGSRWPRPAGNRTASSRRATGGPSWPGWSASRPSSAGTWPSPRRRSAGSSTRSSGGGSGPRSRAGWARRPRSGPAPSSAPAERLGAVVPPGRPRVVAHFPVAAVERIRAGQPARVRLEGFPWTQYGALPATVADVGNEPSEGRIRVELALDPGRPTPIPLAHGLPGSAEVEVERVSPAVLVLARPGSTRGRARRARLAGTIGGQP